MNKEQIVAELTKERDRLDAAIKLLTGGSTTSPTTPSKGRGLSPEVRAKIAAKQKARWAKVKAAKKSKGLK